MRKTPPNDTIVGYDNANTQTKVPLTDLVASGLETSQSSTNPVAEYLAGLSCWSKKLRKRELLEQLAEKQRQITYHERMQAISVAALPKILGLEPLSGNWNESRLFGCSQLVSGVDISCLYRVLFVERGNIVGVHEIDKDRVYIMQSWVTGYGESSALAGMALYSTFKTWACPKAGSATVPADLLLKMNDELLSLKYPGFAPAIVGIIDTQENTFQFSGAGAGPVMVYRAIQGSAITIDFGQYPAVGVFPNELIVSKSPFENKQIALQPHDLLLLLCSNLFDSFRPGDSVDGMGSTDLSNGKRFGQLVEAIVKGSSLSFWLPRERHPEPSLHFPGSGSSPADMLGYIAAVQRLHHVQIGPNKGRVSEKPLVLESYERGYIQKCSTILESASELFPAGDALDVVLMAATIQKAT